MYRAHVLFNGNHYIAGEEICGSKIRYNSDGTVELFDDYEYHVPATEGHSGFTLSNDVWVEVDPDSVVEE